MPKTSPVKAMLESRKPGRSTGRRAAASKLGRKRVTSASPARPIGTLIQKTQCQLR